MDPMAGSPWSTPETVAGFARSAPNATLLRWAADEVRRTGPGRLLDLGCGAGRNAGPLAEIGWRVVGLDLSLPMAAAAAGRGGFHVVLAPMDCLPLRDASADFIVAHGIWNLARSAAEFRRAIHEAARVARPGAGLFVFTFSRDTLPADVAPVPGEPFVFTQFSGEPQCFLTGDQLREELAAAGFHPDPAVPLRVLNRPASAALRTGGPVINEAGFRYGPGGQSRA